MKLLDTSNIPQRIMNIDIIKKIKNIPGEALAKYGFLSLDTSYGDTNKYIEGYKNYHNAISDWLTYTVCYDTSLVFDLLNTWRNQYKFLADFHKASLNFYLETYLLSPYLQEKKIEPEKWLYHVIREQCESTIKKDGLLGNAKLEGAKDSYHSWLRRRESLDIDFLSTEFQNIWLTKIINDNSKYEWCVATTYQDLLLAEAQKISSIHGNTEYREHYRQFLKKITSVRRKIYTSKNFVRLYLVNDKLVYQDQGRNVTKCCENELKESFVDW